LDLGRTIALSPGHIAAISGRVLGVGEACVALTWSLTLKPWWPEGRLAEPGGSLVPGRDV